MWSLIVKDFVSSAKGIGLMVLCYVVFSVFAQFPAHTYLIMGVFAFATQAAYLEEKNHTLVLLKTLPLKASTIVLSKYLSTLLATLLYTVIGLIDLVFVRGMKIELINDFLFGIFVMIAMMGFFLTSFFRSGYSKSSQFFIFLFTLMFIFMMIPTYMPDLLKVLEPIAWIFSFTTWSTLQTLGLEVLMLGLYAFSAYLAIHFFKKRENF